MSRIIFVDDAPEILQHLRRLLAPMQTEWEMQFFPSATQALAAIQETPCDVVVSDMTMPGMDGAKFLGEVCKTCPQTIRIILSGDQSPYNYVRSASVAHRFLQKPFDAATLKSTIEQAEALRAVLGNPALRNLVNEIKTLPSLPSIYQDLMQEMQAPQASLKKAARIVAKDLGMVTKILQLVNSAFFGLRTHVSDPEQAVALLGFDTIKSLVLSSQVFAQFDQAKLPSFSLDELWRHAMLTGTYARRIAKEEGASQQVMDEAFTAALLHDVGVLVLVANRPDDYGRVLDLVRTTQVSDWSAEREVFGADHAHVGAYLLGIWGLSDGIVEAVAFHHHPGDYLASEFRAVTAVHVGNALAETQVRVGDGASEVTGLDQTYIMRENLLPRLTRWRELCVAG
ncbi:MAG: HDOD domain-containing protein [Nitrospira defluvii]|nr:HDOD domain-containing protein [Nitrospira defluvii]